MNDSLRKLTDALSNEMETLVSIDTVEAILEDRFPEEGTDESAEYILTADRIETILPAVRRASAPVHSYDGVLAEIAASLDDPADFDLDAIARDVAEFVAERDGFVLTATTEEFNAALMEYMR